MFRQYPSYARLFINDAHAVSHTLGRNLRWVEIPYPITDIADAQLEANLAPKAEAFAEDLIRPLIEEELFAGVICAEERPKYLVENYSEVQRFLQIMN